MNNLDLCSTDKRLLLIYIAGKYSNGNIEINIQRAREAAKGVWEAGFTALCPHLNTQHFEIDCLCEYDDYILGDLTMLIRCDGIFMMKDWEDSAGALGEHYVAQQCGIPIFKSLEELNTYNWKEYIDGKTTK